MERLHSATTQRWFWPIQIAVGIICISLSIWIVFSPQIGAYALFFLAGIGLIVLGAERIVSGIKAEKSRRKYRILNIGIGAAIIAFFLPGFIVPALVINYLVLFLGFGLLANGTLRIIDGLRRHKKQDEAFTFSSLGMGILITAVAIAVLLFPQMGLALLLIMTVIALVVSGIQVIIAGIRNSRSRSDSSMPQSKIAAEGGEEYQQQQPLNRNGKSIWKNGSWFNDDQGRYLLFRGVNFASRTKLAPYLPIAPLETKNLSQLNLKEEIKSVEPELDRLKDLGFNIVRLLISWKAIEPRPNTNLDELLPEGKQYLTFIKEIIDELHARNLYVFLDFHQDIAHEVYGGDGFPDWALAIDNEHKLPEPSNLRDKKWMIKYVTNKSLKKTLTSFWRNDLTNIDGENKLEHFPVRTHLEKTIGQTARFFRSLNNGAGHPAILGIEPFNEPNPAGLPKEQFEGEFLVDFYRNVDLEIRKFDPDVFIFMEPSVTWTIPSSNAEGGDKSILDLGGGSDPFSARKSFNLDLVKNVMVDGELKPIQLNTFLPKNLNSVSTFARYGVLSFHYYDMMAIASSLADSYMSIPENMYRYKREWPLIFVQLSNAARERGLIPFLTEFGGFQEAEQVRDYLNLQYEQIEAYLLNATYWNYDLYHTKEGKDNWNLENYSLLGPNRTPRNLDAVARPYPMRSSAEPVLLFFDIESKYATIILKGKVVDAPTVIYVPFTLHYAPEFTIWATTSKQIEWDKDNQLLYWYPAKELTLNQIIIGKNRNLDTSKLPKQAKDLASEVTLVGSFS
jgi:uncharacterized membrane protein HdeD (DUF308 family)